MRSLGSVFEAKITGKSWLAIAVCVMTFAGGWQMAKAQVVKGSAETKLTAAQVHDHLRATHGQGRTSAMITNPRASQLDNSAKLAICRSQKQNADREVQDIIPTLHAMGDGSAKPGGSSNPQQLTISGNTKGPAGPTGAPAGPAGNNALTISGNTKGPSSQVGDVNGKNALTITGNTKGPAGQGAAPAGAVSGNNALTITGNTKGPSGQAAAPAGAPTKTAADTGAGPGARPVLGKTESSGGPQIQGSATMANVAGAPCPQPAIKTISGFPMAIFTPGPLFSPYTIKGCGFGSQMGNVYLTGAFNAGKIKLQVQTSGGQSQKSPLRASWTDTMIIVTLDPNLSGELDQTNVTLVVEPVSGSPITKPGNDFLASREVVELAPIAQSKVQFTQPAPSSKGSPATAPSAVYSLNPPGFALLYFTPSSVPAGMSAEVFRGGTTDFFPDGYDYYDLHPLAPGFFVDYFQLHYDPDPTNCDADTAGSRGSWGAQFDSKDNIRVSWKEVRCHQAWMGHYPDVWSEYALNVFVKGPRGIDPWTGKRVLSSIVPAAVQKAH